MQFPLFQVPYLGTGIFIAIDAVTHVIISHGVAIGMVMVVIYGEYLGLKQSSEQWDEFARRLLKLAVLVTTSVGALTGVGIWFITSALEPRGIGSLLRIFFWPWFVEWLVFTAEVIVILVYFYTWKTWVAERKENHIRLGVLYLFLAIASAFLITGILGFMLTPDGWPWSGSFWDAFFNPTFWPQLFLRISGACALGAVFSLAFLQLTKQEEEFRGRALRKIGTIGLNSLILTVLAGIWYLSAVPAALKTHAVFSVLTSAWSQNPEIFPVANAVGALLLLAAMLSARLGKDRAVRILVIPVLVVSLLFVAEFERMREFARGPYVMPGYMYANQVLVAEKQLFIDQGLLKNSYWYNATTAKPTLVCEGQYIFGQNCSVCHTIGGGINDISKRVNGRTQDGIYVIIGHTQEMVPFMSPFGGNDRERRILAEYLYKISTGQVGIPSGSRFMYQGEE